MGSAITGKYNRWKGGNFVSLRQTCINRLVSPKSRHL